VAENNNIATSAEVDAFLAGEEAPTIQQAPLESGPIDGGIASPEEVDQFLKEEKYGGTLEQAKTFAEGAAAEATFGLSTMAEVALGVDPEAINARREVNPNAHAAGQVAGLAGSMMSGVGAGKAVLAAGKQAAKLASHKVAQGAVRQAAEMALVQAGDEVSKMFAQDPRQSMETAMVNIGLSSLIGGAAGGVFSGAVEPLWQATKGVKLEKALAGIQEHAVSKVAGQVMDLAADLHLLPPGTRMLSKLVGKLLPDGGATAALKFLTKEGTIDALGFKNMALAVGAMQRAAKVTGHAVEAVFKSGVDVLPSKMIPTEADVEHLANLSQAAALAPEQVLNATGNLGSYMPEHAEAMGEAVARQVAYINSIRPAQDAPGVLDEAPKLNKVQTSSFNRALTIIEQPLVVLQHVKQGTLTPADVSTIKATHPHFYASLGQKLINQMIDMKDRGEAIPYSTRLSMSLFLGMPLDASITPHSIMVNGMAPRTLPDPNQGPISQPKGNPGAIKSIPKQAMSSSSSIAARRLNR